MRTVLIGLGSIAFLLLLFFWLGGDVAAFRLLLNLLVVISRKSTHNQFK